MRFASAHRLTPTGTLSTKEAGGTRLRVAQHGQCSTPDDFVAAVENL